MSKILAVSSTGLIIDEKVWEIMVALDPHFNELSFEENEGNYLVLNLADENGEMTRWAIVTPPTFEKYFKHMLDGPQVKTYEFVRA